MDRYNSNIYSIYIMCCVCKCLITFSYNSLVNNQRMEKEIEDVCRGYRRMFRCCFFSDDGLMNSVKGS